MALTAFFRKRKPEAETVGDRFQSLNLGLPLYADDLGGLNDLIQSKIESLNTVAQTLIEQKKITEIDAQTLALIDACDTAVSTLATFVSYDNGRVFITQQGMPCNTLQKDLKRVKSIAKRMQGRRRTVAAIALEIVTLVTGFALLAVGAVLTFTSLIDFGLHAPVGIGLMALGGAVLGICTLTSSTMLLAPARRKTLGREALDFYKFVQDLDKKPLPHIKSSDAPGNRTDISFVKHGFNITDNRAFRETCYEKFKSDKKARAITAEDRRDGLRVYVDNTGYRAVIDSKVLKMSLSRRAGHTIRHDQRWRTKHRVIASQASYPGTTAGEHFSTRDLLRTTTLTSCAPNLRKRYRRTDSENPGDTRKCLYSDGTLNIDAYREEMRGVWFRFLHAANEEAKLNGTKTCVVTPLVGGRAYLEGYLSPKDIERAKYVIIESLYEVASMRCEDDFKYFKKIKEIFLCLPNSKDGSISDDYKKASEVISRQGYLPDLHVPLTVVNCDLLEMGKALQDNVKRTVTLINPGNDHVPGGGAYNDRPKRGATRDSASDNDSPGPLNLKPNALEEQLAVLGNFLYTQNLDQNGGLQPDFIDMSAECSTYPICPEPKLTMKMML